MVNIFQKITISVIFFLAVFLIILNITKSPRVWLDEGIFTEVAKNLAWHGVQGIQIAPNQIMSSAVVSTSGYPLIFPVAASFRLFGTGLWQARLPMILFMLSLVTIFYFFSKKRQGFYWAIFSVLLLLSFSPFYGNGRPVQGEVPGLVFLMLGSLLFLYWEEGLFADERAAAFSGLFFGLSAATKPLFLIVLVPSLLLSFFVFLKKTVNRENLLLFFGGFTVPIIAWLLIQFPSFNLFQKALSAYASGNSDSSAPVRFLIKSNFISFFTETTPALFLVLMVFNFSIFGYFYFIAKKRLFSQAEFILFVFAAVNWAAYLKGPAWYRHFFPAQILALLLFSLAVPVLYRQAQNKFIKNAVVIFTVIFILFQFYHLFFLSQNSPLNSSNQNSLLENALMKIGLEKSVFFYDSIGAAIFLPHDNYFQYLRPTDYLEFGRNGLKNLSYDYILTRRDIDIDCYVKQELGKYYLYERKMNCQNASSNP